MAQDRGGYLHDPVRMFSVWMYGLMQGRASSRQLEDACRYDVRYGFLAGGTRPDHSTLARFLERFEDCLAELLELVAREGKSQGLLGARPIAIDGTKLPGSCSQWSKALALASEADARPMMNGKGQFVTGYNAQVAVDMQSTFIAGQCVSNAATDQNQMEPVLDAIEKEQGELPSEVVMDAGYDSSHNHDTLENRGVTGYIHPCRTHLRVFQPDENGVLRCRARHVPSLTQTTKNGRLYDVYRVSQCRHCPFREDCKVSAKSHQKEMTVRSGTRLGAREDGAMQAASARGQELLARRGQSVELVFARLKAGFKFTRFKLRNLRGVRLEFALVSLAYNIRLLIRAILALFQPKIPSNPVVIVIQEYKLPTKPNLKAA